MLDLPYRPSLGVQARKYASRTGRPAGVAIHTTGSGPAVRVKPELDKRGKFAKWRERHPNITTPFQAAEWVYRAAMHSAPHVLICGETGEAVRLCPDDLCAWHIGSKDQAAGRMAAEVYKGRSWHARAPWWAERWPELTSPRDFLGGRLWVEGSANDLLLGIDVAPRAGDPLAPWSPKAQATVARVVNAWCAEHRIPCTRHYVLTHSDAHPTSRTARGKPTDPGPRQWPGFGEWFSDVAGAPW